MSVRLTIQQIVCKCNGEQLLQTRSVSSILWRWLFWVLVLVLVLVLDSGLIGLVLARFKAISLIVQVSKHHSSVWCYFSANVNFIKALAATAGLAWASCLLLAYRNYQSCVQLHLVELNHLK